MNTEQALAATLNKPDLKVLSGSRLYGTSTPDSDYDYRGFVVPPIEYLIGLRRFDHQIVREPDIVLYSIRRFFELLIAGDPAVYEILFAPEQNIESASFVGNMVLAHRDVFACKQFARRIRGYAHSEWRKVTGTQLVPVKRTPTEDQVIENIRETFMLPKPEMDEVIRLLFLHHPREIRPARRKLGAKRKEQIERFGYCTSSACHSIRLLGQLAELMATGQMTFPRPNCEQLLSIKRGEIPLRDVVLLYDSLDEAAVIAEEESSLPNRASIKDIWRLYHRVMAETFWSNEYIKRYYQEYHGNFRETKDAK